MNYMKMLYAKWASHQMVQHLPLMQLRIATSFIQIITRLSIMALDHPLAHLSQLAIGKASLEYA